MKRPSPRHPPNINFQTRIEAYCRDHQRVIALTVRNLIASPLNTLLTCSVIAIALALPIGFYILLENVKAISPEWQGHNQISLFLDKNIDNNKAQKLSNELKQWPEIKFVNIISKQEALEEFQEQTGISDILMHLPENPLPIVLEILPTNAITSNDQIESLLEKLQGLNPVEIAQLDLEWAQKLSSIIKIGQYLAFGLIIILSSGVILTIGNTIRLEIESRRQEIEVTQLVGATRAFIRRPFLYTGIMYGALGGFLALLILFGFLWALSDPIAQLSSIYGNKDLALTLSTYDAFYVILIGILLGLTGAWFSVNRHLDEIQLE